MTTEAQVVEQAKTLAVNGDTVPGAAPIVRSGGGEADLSKMLAGQVTQIVWDKQRVDVIKRQICPFGITEDEFLLFMLTCQRTGTDPLMGECFCVPRKVKVKKNGSDEYVERKVYQIAEQGLEARADRHADYGGTTSGAYYEKDEISIDFANGKVKHVVNPTAPRGKLLGAWAISLRSGRVPYVAELKLSERIQTFPSGDPLSQWKTQPDHMIEKCARAEAIRKAYPNTFSGIYIQAEVPETDEKELPGGSTAPAGKTQTERVGNQVARVAGRTVDAAPTQAQTPAPTQAAAPAAPTEPVARWGEHQGKTLASLTTEQLKSLKGKYDTSLLDPANQAKSYLPAMRENFAQVCTELEKRAAAAVAREPGSDDGDVPNID